jgi:hypothetical protein
MEALIPINIAIGDRTFRIKIQPKDEEVVRKTIKVINEKIVEFRTMFAGKDIQDYISMVLVWFATEQNANMTFEVEKDNLANKLTSLEKLLDKQLQQNP